MDVVVIESILADELVLRSLVISVDKQQQDKKAKGHRSHIFIRLNCNAFWTPVQFRLSHQRTGCWR